MKGKDFSNMIKTMRVLRNSVPVTHSLKIVDPAHVCMMEIDTLDGSPIFGGHLSSDVSLDIDTISKVVIPNVEYDISISEQRVHLSHPDHEISFLIHDKDVSDPIIPRLSLLEVASFDPKALRDLVNSIRADKVMIWSDGDILRATMDDIESKHVTRIGEVDPEVHKGLKSYYPVDYLKRILKVVRYPCRMCIDTDYPLTMEWEDGFYKYRYLLAPRIIED